MIREHSLVVLTHGIPAHSLLAGDVGTVVHVYPEHVAFEVEFMSGLGKTLAVLTLKATEVRPVAAEILHVRSLAVGVKRSGFRFT